MNHERLKQIFKKTDGNCHLCFKKLKFSNYAKYGLEGPWEIEHSKAKAIGGSNHLNNLFPACIPCNIEKGTLNSRTIRLRYGKLRTPYSKHKKEYIRAENTAAGVIVGSIIGVAVMGPAGGILCGVIGGVIGNNNSPKK